MTIVLAAPTMTYGRGAGTSGAGVRIAAVLQGDPAGGEAALRLVAWADEVAQGLVRLADHPAGSARTRPAARRIPVALSATWSSVGCVRIGGASCSGEPLLQTSCAISSRSASGAARARRQAPLALGVRRRSPLAARHAPAPAGTRSFALKAGRRSRLAATDPGFARVLDAGRPPASIVLALNSRSWSTSEEWRAGPEEASTRRAPSSRSGHARHARRADLGQGGLRPRGAVAEGAQAGAAPARSRVGRLRHRRVRPAGGRPRGTDPVRGVRPCPGRDQRPGRGRDRP